MVHFIRSSLLLFGIDSKHFVHSKRFADLAKDVHIVEARTSFQHGLASSERASVVIGAYGSRNGEGVHEGARSCNRTELDEFAELFDIATFPSDVDLVVAQHSATGQFLKGNALLILPDQDKTGAFQISESSCYQLYNLARQYRDVRVLHVSTILEAMTILKLYPMKSIKHLVVAGVGSQTSIVFNSELFDGKLTSWDSRAMSFWDLAKEKLMTQAEVFLYSSQQVQNMPSETFFTYVSQRLEWHMVYASRIPEGQTMASAQSWVVEWGCKDEPFKSNSGDSCAAFAEKGLCFLDQNEAKRLLQWREWKKWKEDVVAAKRACCKCGGGDEENGLICPAGASEAAGVSDHCECSLGMCIRGNGDACPTNSGSSYRMFLASCKDCLCIEDRCPAWSWKGPETKEGKHCFCPPGSQCYDGDLKGCPATVGPHHASSTKKFDKTCTTCTCKPDRKVASCSGRSCTCSHPFNCYKGDRLGECPVPWRYAKGSRVAQITPHDRFDAWCDGCQCRK